MTTRTFAPIPKAGPLGITAAAMHPDDPLPRTWRIVGTWTYRGQRGAYLVRDVAGLPLRAHRDARGRREYAARQPDFAQVVYRRSAPRRRTSHTGNAIRYAAQHHVSRIGAYADWADRHARRAYYAEQGVDIEPSDRTTAPLPAPPAPRTPDEPTAAQRGRAALVAAMNRQPRAAGLTAEQFAHALERAERHIERVRSMSIPDRIRLDVTGLLSELAHANGWRVPPAWADDLREYQ